MLTRTRALGLVAAFLVGSFGVGASLSRAQELAPGASRVTVQGRQVAAGKYMIAIQTQLARPDEFDGVLIFAEPSHTLLLAEDNGQEGGVTLRQGERPLVSVQGPLAENAPQVVVPYASAGDTRIVVQLVSGAGRLTVSDGKINVAAFSFSTTFPASVSIDAPISGDPFTHCVTCGSCGKMCVECDGPKFSANCINCTISCGW